MAVNIFFLQPDNRLHLRGGFGNETKALKRADLQGSVIRELSLDLKVGETLSLQLKERMERNRKYIVLKKNKLMDLKEDCICLKSSFKYNYIKGKPSTHASKMFDKIKFFSLKVFYV